MNASLQDNVTRCMKQHVATPILKDRTIQQYETRGITQNCDTDHQNGREAQRYGTYAASYPTLTEDM